MIASIVVSLFNIRTLPEICAMGGIIVVDFTSIMAYREIFRLGRQEEEQKGRQTEASAITVRQLQRR